MEQDLNYHLGRIEAELKGITEKISFGFENVHKRLDKVNGRLDKHDDKIDVLEKSEAENRGAAKVTAIIWGAIVAVGVSVVSTIIGFVIFRK